jgi:hypothetical protein
MQALVLGSGIILSLFHTENSRDQVHKETDIFEVPIAIPQWLWHPS